MKLCYKRIISSLCAAVMVLAWFASPALLSEVRAAPEDSADVWALDIEFGSLSFTYDYGVWDVNDMRYEASATSEDPAKGTVSGYPGWYGFDGKANYIRVINNSVQGHPITVSLSFRPLTTAEANGLGLQRVTGVTMALSGGLEGGVGWAGGANAYTKAISAGTWSTVYVHFSGTPQNADGTRYASIGMTPVGLIVVRIDEWQ